MGSHPSNKAAQFSFSSNLKYGRKLFIVVHGLHVYMWECHPRHLTIWVDMSTKYVTDHDVFSDPDHLTVLEQLWIHSSFACTQTGCVCVCVCVITTNDK